MRGREDMRIGLLSAVLLAVLAVIVLSSGAANGYSGSLSSATGGITGTGVWITTGPTTLDWLVTPNGDGSWHYSYTLSVAPTGGISHLIIETSPDFTKDLILNPSWDLSKTFVGSWDSSNGNPDMPGAGIYGIKFNDVSEDMQTLSYEFSFDAFRNPVCGDFYAKDGNAGNPQGVTNTAWNTGFDSLAPTMPPDQCDFTTKILVPDTETTVIPEAGSLVLASLGMLPVLGLKLRRRR